MVGILGMPGVLLLCVCLGSCAKNVVAEGQGARGEGYESTESRIDGVEDSVVVVETEAGNYEITEVRTEAVPQDVRETLESPKVVRKTCASFSQGVEGQEVKAEEPPLGGSRSPQSDGETLRVTGYRDAESGNYEITEQPKDTAPQTIDTIPQVVEERYDETTEVRNEEVEETVPQADPSVAVATAPLVMGAVEEAASNTNVESQEEIQHIDTIQQAKQRAPYLAVRTNLLYDAVLVPNVGLEVWLGAGFTLGVDWFYTWIPLDQQHFYWQTYGGYLTARYYFGKQAAAQPYGGHHVGIYGSMLTYDVEFGGRGYQADKFGFGGGVEYGYSLPVAKNLCLDFNLGIGYQGGEYKTYLPTDDGTGHYVWEGTYKRHWFGPTKAEISLKWLIGPAEKKGGAE